MMYSACAFWRLEVETSVSAPSLTSGIMHALVTVEGDPCRFRFDGGEPSPTEGHLVSAGDTFMLESPADVANFKVVSSRKSVLQITGYQ